MAAHERETEGKPPSIPKNLSATLAGAKSHNLASIKVGKTRTSPRLQQEPRTPARSSEVARHDLGHGVVHQLVMTAPQESLDSVIRMNRRTCLSIRLQGIVTLESRHAVGKA